MSTQKSYYKFTASPLNFSARLRARTEGRPDKFRESDLQILANPRAFRPELPSVAVVGTRRPSPYGLRFVQELMAALHGYPVQILSGGALGIDAEVHRAALDNQLSTQVWLVGPLLKPNPRRNWPLFQRVLETAGSALVVPSVLEPPPGGNPLKPQWIERNWWLAAASDALVAVEADLKSGTYASVRAATDLGIPVFLLPGSIYNPKSSGINEMISMGCGHAVASVESLVKRLVEEILANPYNNNWEARKNNAGSPDIGHIDLKWSKFLADIACEGQGLEEAELYERALRLGWSWWEISEKLSLLLDHGILAKAGSLIERRSL